MLQQRKEKMVWKQFSCAIYQMMGEVCMRKWRTSQQLLAAPSRTLPLTLPISAGGTSSM